MTLHFSTPRSSFFSAALFLLTAFMIFGRLAGADDRAQCALPQEIEPGLVHLLGLIDQPSPALDGSLIGKVVDFAAEAKPAETEYLPPALEDATPAYFEFEVRSGLSRFLQYAYSRDIPAQAFSPSLLRSAQYLPVAGEVRRPPDSWDVEDPKKTTRIVRLAEHEEITPDPFSGAYYEYDVDRLLILTWHGDKPLFITVARQRDTSSVGKKGAVIDPIDHWDFLYSLEKGLTHSGLGWVDSYMYKSFSVAIFQPSGPERLRLSFFKWLSAGWAGFNMVQTKHIRSGLERYAKDIRYLIENPSLPASEKMAAYFTGLNRLSTEELQTWMDKYLEIFKKQHETNAVLSQKTFTPIFEQKDYVRNLRRDQLLSIQGLEYLKCVVEKPCRFPDLRQGPSGIAQVH